MLSSMGVSELRWAGKGISTVFGFARSTYRVTFAARYILTHTAKTIAKNDTVAPKRAGVEAKFGFKARPHMLMHACGYALANKGHDTRALQAYLGHENI
jgi:integrase